MQCSNKSQELNKDNKIPLKKNVKEKEKENEKKQRIIEMKLEI